MMTCYIQYPFQISVFIIFTQIFLGKAWTYLFLPLVKIVEQSLVFLKQLLE